MLDWNLYLKQLTVAIGRIATANPEILRGYRALSEAGRKTGKFDAKPRELSLSVWP